MTPDAWSNLQFINCTEFDLQSGAGGSNEGFFNQYQMSSWFGFPTAPNPVVAAGSTNTYMLQFLRGVGDQDDAADIQINLGNGNNAAANVVWLQARSNTNSSHYFQAKVQGPSQAGHGPFVIAVTPRGPWPTHDASTLTWYASGQTAPMGAPDDTQCLAIVDLGLFFPPDLNQQFCNLMRAGSLSSNDSGEIWYQVQHYMGFLKR